MFKFTLVPSEFFVEGSAYDFLSSVTPLDETVSVKSIELPQYKAVLVYCGNDVRASVVQKEAESLTCVSYFNKVLVGMCEKGYVDVLIALGKKLVIMNSFRAEDAVTALFYIVSAMAEFKLKPGLSVLNVFGTDTIGLTEEAIRIFKGVEVVS